MAKIVIKDIIPKMGLPGGVVKITGKRFQPWDIANGDLHFSNSIGWIEGISESTLITTVPEDSKTGNVYIDIEGVQSNHYHFTVPEPLAIGLHLVDNPVVDSEGNIYATFSGGRGEFTPVSVYKINRSGEKESYLTGIVNSTSLIIGRDNALYIASRFDGKIYRSHRNGDFEVFSQGLGLAFGLAMNSKGELFVGDRTGSIFQIDLDGKASFYASIPQSYIAFHLAFDSKDNLYVSNPVHMGENTIYKITDQKASPEVYYTGLSLFHGFAIDKYDNIYLSETKRNESRIIKINDGIYQSTVLSGTNFIGVAFDKKENLVVATASSLYIIDKESY